jgi:AcrR family transcriptional regulator
MDAAHSLVAALRTLLSEKPYGKITVQDLCDTAYLSRRTFYKHYRDKADVVRAMVHEDYIDPPIAMRGLMDLREFKSSARLLSESTFGRVFENRVCYENLLQNMGKLLLLEMILEANYHFTLSVIKDYDYPQDEMDYAAYVMGSVTAVTSIRWIEQGYQESSIRLAQLYNTWIMGHWRELGFPQK